MNHYIEITLNPNRSNKIYELRSGIMANIHNALVLLQSTTVGVSFPSFDGELHLGPVIRLHGSNNMLQSILEMNVFSKMSDVIYITDVLEVPDTVDGYQSIHRIQQTMSMSKLNRLIKRGSIKTEDINKYKAKMCRGLLDNPYFELMSQSSKQRFRTYLQFNDKSELVEGEFNSYGLSKSATVPIF
jgi:CRISPR-associated endonuclease Csy4